MSKEQARRSPVAYVGQAKYRQLSLFEGGLPYPVEYQDSVPKITVIWPDKHPLARSRAERGFGPIKLVLAAGLLLSTVVSPSGRSHKTTFMSLSVPVAEASSLPIKTETPGPDSIPVEIAAKPVKDQTTHIFENAELAAASPAPAPTTPTPETSLTGPSVVTQRESVADKNLKQEQVLRTALEPLPTPKGADPKFWKEAALNAADLYPKYKIPISSFLTQLEKEQGGRDIPSHNLVGIKGVGPAGSAGEYRRYNNIRECIEDYFKLISGYRRVSPLIQSGDSNSEDYLRAIAQSGYAEDSGYLNSLIFIYKQLRLVEYDKAVEDLFQVVT